MMRYLITLLFMAALILAPGCETTLSPSASESSSNKADMNSFKGLDTLFSNYDIIALNAQSLSQKARSGQVTVTLRGVSRTLILTPEDIRGVDNTGRRIELPGDAHQGHYSGSVKGVPNSHVRLTVRPDLIRGFVRTPAGILFIDPVREHINSESTTSSADFIVYSPEDVISDEPHACGVQDQHHIGAISEQGFAPVNQSRSHKFSISTKALESGVATTVNLATDADFEFFTKYGSVSAANTNIASVINQVNGIYDLPEYNVTYAISSQHVWSSASSPYPYTSTDNSVLLSQFRTYWNANETSVTRDIAHLFSGKNIDGNVIGTAYLGVVWTNASYSYGFSQDTAPMSYIVAHEIGHNFDAEHICADCKCPQCSDSTGPIMCPCIQSNGEARFSDNSSCTIDNWIDHFQP